MIWFAFFSGSLFGATIVGWAAVYQIRKIQPHTDNVPASCLTTEDAARRVVV